MSDQHVPSEITLTYRPVGNGHVFTAVGMPGFYISSSDRRKAFESSLPALSAHASHRYKCHVNYCTDTTYEAFEEMLTGSNVSASMVVAHRRANVAS